MNDLDVIRGLEDILMAINSKLDDYKDDDRISEYINEILYGKVVEVNGKKDLIGGTWALEQRVRELRGFIQTEEEIKSLKEAYREMGDSRTSQAS